MFLLTQSNNDLFNLSLRFLLLCLCVCVYVCVKNEKQAVGKAKDGYGAARKTESEKKAELRAVQEKLKAAFTALEEMSKARDEEGGGVNTLFEEKKALHEKVGILVVVVVVGVLAGSGRFCLTYIFFLDRGRRYWVCGLAGTSGVPCWNVVLNLA